MLHNTSFLTIILPPSRRAYANFAEYETFKIDLTFILVGGGAVEYNQYDENDFGSFNQDQQQLHLLKALHNSHSNIIRHGKF